MMCYWNHCLQERLMLILRVTTDLGAHALEFTPPHGLMTETSVNNWLGTRPWIVHGHSHIYYNSLCLILITTTQLLSSINEKSGKAMASPGKAMANTTSCGPVIVSCVFYEYVPSTCTSPSKYRLGYTCTFTPAPLHDAWFTVT